MLPSLLLIPENNMKKTILLFGRNEPRKIKGLYTQERMVFKKLCCLEMGGIFLYVSIIHKILF